MRGFITAEEASKNTKDVIGDIKTITKRELNKIKELIISASNNGKNYIELYIPKIVLDKVDRELIKNGYHTNRPIMKGNKKENEIELGIKWY